MAITLYGLKTCDTCRKALKAIQNSGLEVTYLDVRADGVPAETLQHFITVFNEDVMNKRSTTWRSLSEEEREKSALALLIEHPTLMKRPVIDMDGALYLGWGKEVQAAVLPA